MALGQDEAVAQRAFIGRLGRIDVQDVPIGGGQHVDAGQRGRQMRRLRLVRHVDDLAAQFRGLFLQRAGVDLGGGLADCNVHRPAQRAQRGDLAVRACGCTARAVLANRH